MSLMPVELNLPKANIFHVGGFKYAAIVYNNVIANRLNQYLKVYDQSIAQNEEPRFVFDVRDDKIWHLLGIKRPDDLIARLG